MLPSAVALLPTPAVNDMGAAYTPEQWDAWTAKMQAAHGNGNGHGKSLEIETRRLAPVHGYLDRVESMTSDPTLLRRAQEQRWGVYAAAIARWERLTRPAPPPTQPSKKGTPQLSPAFSEWMMGLPAGHVTDVPGLSRNDMLKALGNGVVPQQAAAAVGHLLGVISATEVAA